MPDFKPLIDFQKSVVIPSSSTTSNSADFTGSSLVGLIMPNTFTGTIVTFQTTINDTTYVDLYNKDGTQLRAVVAANRAIFFTPGDFIGARWIRLISNATESGSRTIQLILRSLA